MATTNSKKKTIYVGGLTEEVDEKVLRAAFIPFGDISEVQIPQDYETEKHRGFAFIDYELPEDAQGRTNSYDNSWGASIYQHFILAAIDNMHDSELFGRTLRVNLAKPLRIKEGATRPVWADEEWLQMYDSGKKEGKTDTEADPPQPTETPAKRSAQEAVEAAGAMVKYASKLFHNEQLIYFIFFYVGQKS